MNNNLSVALTKCFYCLEDNEIILNTRPAPKYASAVQEMHGRVTNMEPCQKCKDFMKQGIIVILADDSKSDPGWEKAEGIPNPYRTGEFAVVKEEILTRIFKDINLKHRWTFMDITAAQKIGLLDAIRKQAK